MTAWAWLRSIGLCAAMVAAGCGDDDDSDPAGDGGSSLEDASEPAQGGHPGGRAGSSASDHDAGEDTAHGPDAATSHQDASAPVDDSGTADSGTGNDDHDAGPAVTGPGIGDEEGEHFCLREQADLAAAFYFGIQKQCSILNKKDGELSEAEVMAYDYACTDGGGMIVDACPADGRVAYCAGDEILSHGTVSAINIIYESPVNPDAASVARDAIGVCKTSPAFDLDDHPLSAKCSGSFAATVDGTMIDFSKQLTCLFKTDGERQSFMVRGSSAPSSPDAKELTLYLLKMGSTIELKNELGQAGYGYLDANTTFAIPLDDSTPMYTSDAFETDGSAINGGFELSLGKSGSATGADARVMTDGKLDLQLELQ